jgi:hypothetical protein
VTFEPLSEANIVLQFERNWVSQHALSTQHSLSKWIHHHARTTSFCGLQVSRGGNSTLHMFIPNFWTSKSGVTMVIRPGSRAHPDNAPIAKPTFRPLKEAAATWDILGRRMGSLFEPRQFLLQPISHPERLPPPGKNNMAH